MEKKLYEAAAEGNVSSLLKLLQEDALLLDRFISGCYSETPLHIASMRGHVQFVDEILIRNPEIAKELDSRRSSPLHLVAAKGYLDIVKRLLQVSPDTCFVCDRDGRNPVHIAAIKGHLSMLRELVQARPHAARVLMERDETILHACVRYNQLEALKFLVETVADHEFLNCKNYDGNTILHLAVADKQIEAVKFLVATTTVEVNSINVDGVNAIDLLSQNEGDVKDREITEFLRRVGAVSGKGIPLSKHELEAARSKILFTPTGDVLHPKKHKKRFGRHQRQYSDWLERKKNSLMVVASLIATMAFQAGVSPPSGFWQDNSDRHKAGYSVLADNYPNAYGRFLAFNTTGFVASLSIILLLVSGLPFRRRVFMWILMVIMWIAITAMAMTYLFSISAYTPDHEYDALLKVIGTVVLVWMGLMLLLLLGHTIRLAIRMIRYLGKLLRPKRHSRTVMTNNARV